MDTQKPNRLNGFFTNVALTPLFLTGVAAMIPVIAAVFSLVLLLTIGQFFYKGTGVKGFLKGSFKAMKGLALEISDAVHLTKADKDSPYQKAQMWLLGFSGISLFTLVVGIGSIVAEFEGAFMFSVLPTVVASSPAAWVPLAITAFFITVPPLAFGLLRLTQYNWQDLHIFPLKMSFFKKKPSSDLISQEDRSDDLSSQPGVDSDASYTPGQSPSDSGDSSDYNSDLDNDEDEVNTTKP